METAASVAGLVKSIVLLVGQESPKHPEFKNHFRRLVDRVRGISVSFPALTKERTSHPSLKPALSTLQTTLERTERLLTTLSSSSQVNGSSIQLSNFHNSFKEQLDDLTFATSALSIGFSTIALTSISTTSSTTTTRATTTSSSSTSAITTSPSDTSNQAQLQSSTSTMNSSSTFNYPQQPSIPDMKHAFDVDSWLKSKGFTSLTDTIGEKKDFPLSIAVRDRDPVAVEALLNAGADANQMLRFVEMTALHVAAQTGADDCVRVLISHPRTKVNPVAMDLSTPLFLACQNGHLEAVKILLAHERINLDDMGENEVSALYISAQEGHTDVVTALLAHPGVQVNAAMKDGWTPLHAACLSGDGGCVRALLTHRDIDVNAREETGATPLHVCCDASHEDCLRALLSHPNVDVNLQEREGWTALHISSSEGDLDCVKALLETGRAVYHPPGPADSPRSLAERHGHSDVVAYLSAYLKK